MHRRKTSTALMGMWFRKV